jgi:O-methyltransferase
MSRFVELYELGTSRSACAPAQLQSLVEIVKAAEKVPGDIIEIGSYKCGSTIVLAAASELCSPNKTVFGFDIFKEMPAGSKFDQDLSHSFGDLDFEEIKSVTEQISNLAVVRGLHEETIPVFPPRPISILFLDSDLYESHRIALEHFWPMLSENGLLILHDFVSLNCPGVRKAFDEYFKNSLESVIKHSYQSGMLVVQK